MRFKMAPRAHLTLVHEYATLKTIMMENAKHAKDSLLQTALSMWALPHFLLLLQNSLDPQITPGGNPKYGWTFIGDIWKRLVYSNGLVSSVWVGDVLWAVSLKTHLPSIFRYEYSKFRETLHICLTGI